jgi:hypothetical protein
MKHTDKETITRIPLFTTTNIDLWAWTEDAEKQPLQQRYKEFETQHRIQNEIDSPYTIPQPKETITHNQIVGLIYKYGEEITDKIIETETNRTASKDYIPIPSESTDTFLTNCNIIKDIIPRPTITTEIEIISTLSSEDWQPETENEWMMNQLLKNEKEQKNSTNYGYGQSTHTTQQKWNTQYNAFHANIIHTHLNKKKGTKKVD